MKTKMANYSFYKRNIFGNQDSMDQTESMPRGFESSARYSTMRKQAAANHSKIESMR